MEAEGARAPSRGWGGFAGLAGWLVAALLRALGWTWRCQLEGPHPMGHRAPAIGALWHGGLICAAYFFRDQQLVVPISRSRDGDRVVEVLRHLGFGAFPRGSSSRGGTTALLGLIRAARAGRRIAMLCDGPRGPAHRVKPGSVALAGAAGLPLYPLAIAARPCLTFGSWDRAFLPWPFARVVFRFGNPMRVRPDASDDELEACRGQLESDLLRLNRELRGDLERGSG